jgi:hypothetical protein
MQQGSVSLGQIALQLSFEGNSCRLAGKPYGRADVYAAIKKEGGEQEIWPGIGAAWLYCDSNCSVFATKV